MDSMAAMAMGMANRGDEPKVFDWDKAAKILKERKVQNAMAGLSEDWGWTGNTILEDGKINKDSECIYLSSTWATPVLEIDGEMIECWKMASERPGQDSQTMWPANAQKIFGIVDVQKV